MKLIIDIPDEEYNRIKEWEDNITGYQTSLTLYRAVRNGIPYEEKPQGKRAERALAIIDRLRTDGHINNKEQGTLRRAILLPERPQGEWKEHQIMGRDFFGNGFICECGRIVMQKENFCPNCGTDMRGAE